MPEVPRIQNAAPPPRALEAVTVPPKADGWIIHATKNVEDALEEIKHGGDRAAAIVAASLVEAHLTTAMKATLHRNEKIVNELFRNSGPLGNFSTKIDLAFLIGMFSAECHKELNIIRTVRNLFAHDLRIKGFASQRMTDLVSNLVKHEFGFSITNLDRDKADKHYLVYCPDADPPTNARERYIRACKYYTAIMSMQIPGRTTMPRPFF